jgi:hypothetical protein
MAVEHGGSGDKEKEGRTAAPFIQYQKKLLVSKFPQLFPPPAPPGL